MADQKLTDRAALATAPAQGDLIHIVDVSDSTDSAAGSSYKITISTLQEGIDHNSLLNYEADQHRSINDSGSSNTDLWSASKISGEISSLSESFVLACSDETTELTATTGVAAFRMPYAFTVTEVRASLTTASTSGAVSVDINEGSTSILSTVITIDQNEKTSTTATTAAVISDSSLSDDSEITVDIDSAGTGATGLKVYIIGHKT